MSLMSALPCRYGSLVRLLTEGPPPLADADLVKLQRGMCAACRNPLPPAAKAVRVPGRALGQHSEHSRLHSLPQLTLGACL